MARGRELHQLRITQRQALGKPLSRRARSKCELCQESSPLEATELLPTPNEPISEWALLLCKQCQPLLTIPPSIDNASRLQFLHETIWSEIEPIQITSIRLVKQLEKMGTPWVQGMLDSLYIDPDTERKL